MRLKECRAEKKMTTIELGKQIGVSPSAITNWETGLRKPNIDMLIRLAKVLGCTPNDILGFGEGRTPEKNEEEKTPVAG